MTRRDRQNIRILGIDPCSRGFGFAVFDAPDFLNDWGVAKVYGKEATAYAIRIEAMVDRYLPDIVALPHPADYKRRPLIRQVATALIRRTASRPVAVRLVSKDSVRNAFPGEARAKYDRAVFLTKVLPELKELLPAPRKVWESEDARMNVFDALGLILATPEGTAQSSKAASLPD